MAEPTPETARRGPLKSSDVCEIVKVQPYVLRSWEKEFPDLGTSRSEGGPRYYRQSDVERVVRLKQLVFGEGLTLAGARRRLEEERGGRGDDLPFEEPPALDAEAKRAIESVRTGLRALLDLLAQRPHDRQTSGDAHAGPAADVTPADGADAAGKKSRRRRPVAIAETTDGT